jgi:hypothetical protein
MRWVGHVIHKGHEKLKFYLEILNVRNHLKDLGIDGRIILKYLKKIGCGEYGLESFGSG